MLVTKVSSLTGKENTMDLNVTQEQLDRHASRTELAQHIFPDLSREEREFLISGITPKEWNKMFGG